MTDCEKGTSAEVRFIFEADGRGYKVYLPIGHAHATDIVILRPKKRPACIQIKTATYYPRRDAYGVSTSRGSKNKKIYARGDFQILAAWLPDRQKFVFWRFDEIRKRKKINYTPRLHRQPDNWDLLDSVLQ
jgi:hypothetical protein